MGTQLSQGVTAAPPSFGPCLFWRNGWIDIPFGYGGIGLGPGDIMLYGDTAKPTRGDSSPPPLFGPVWRTAVWIKMPLRTEVNLGPGHTALDADPAPRPQKGHSIPTIFSTHISILWPKGRPSQLLLSTCRPTVTVRAIGLVRLACSRVRVRII